MTIRYSDALRALISSFDRVSRERADNRFQPDGGLFLWPYQIDAPPGVKRLARLLGLIEQGFAEARRTGTGMHRWRPTPAGRAAIEKLDRAIEAERAELGSGGAAAAAARRHALLKQQLRRIFADHQPHRLRKLNTELGADLRSILSEVVERGEVRKVAPGWYISGRVPKAAKPGMTLPSFASRTAELLDALAVPRTVPELVKLLGKSRQAVSTQLKVLEERGLVEGPPVMRTRRQWHGLWRRALPASDDVKPAR